MFKIVRALMILLILFSVMGLIGWGGYRAVQNGFSGIYHRTPARNTVNNGSSYDGEGSGTGLKSATARNNSPELFMSEISLPDRERDPFSKPWGLARLVKNIFVIGMISLVVGGIDAFIGRLKRRSSGQ